MLNKEVNNITTFIINGLLFFICWSILYKFLLAPYTNIDLNLSTFLVTCSDYMLSLFGYTTQTQTTEGMVIIALKGTDGNGVWVGNNCNGLSLFALFSFYCFSFPKSKNIPSITLVKNWSLIISSTILILSFYNANIYLNYLLTGLLLLSLGYFVWNELNSKKLIFVIIGLFSIHLVNVFRTSALTIMEKDYREHLDFNHTYTFQIIVYGVVFYLWYLWASKFILTNEKKS